MIHNDIKHIYQRTNGPITWTYRSLCGGVNILKSKKWNNNNNNNKGVVMIHIDIKQSYQWSNNLDIYESVLGVYVHHGSQAQESRTYGQS